MGKDMHSKSNITRYQLCGTQGCCPTVEIYHDTNMVVISDDYGGKVKLTKEQWREALSMAKIET